MKKNKQTLLAITLTYIMLVVPNLNIFSHPFLSNDSCSSSPRKSFYTYYRLENDFRHDFFFLPVRVECGNESYYVGIEVSAWYDCMKKEYERLSYYIYTFHIPKDKYGGEVPYYYLGTASSTSCTEYGVVDAILKNEITKYQYRDTKIKGNIVKAKGLQELTLYKPEGMKAGEAVILEYDFTYSPFEPWKNKCHIKAKKGKYLPHLEGAGGAMCSHYPRK